MIDRPRDQRRNRFYAATLGLLALVTGFLVYATIRAEPAPPARAELAPGLGAVAVTPGSVWRWSAGSGCERTTGTAQTVAEHRDGAAWTGSTVPLSTIRRLAFADDRHGVAFGTDERCFNAVAATSDAGATWVRLPQAQPYAVDYALGGAWRVQQDAQLVRTVERAAGPAGPWTRTANPCDERDGYLYDVSAVTATSAWLVCQGPAAGVRLVLRTTDGGRTWERRVDARPQTGLDGDVTIRRLELTTGPAGWVLMTGSPRCPEGELRATADSGLTWTALPCPGAAVPLRTVFDIAFRPDGTGVLLGLSRGERVLLETGDGGRSWRLAP